MISPERKSNDNQTCAKTSFVAAAWVLENVDLKSDRPKNNDSVAKQDESSPYQKTLQKQTRKRHAQTVG